MADVLEVLRSHRSIRKYKADPVPNTLLESILNAARQAPTSANLQAYSIVVVRDQEKKKTLARFCGDQRWIEECPVFLAMCPDLHRIERICRMRGYTFSDQFIEISIVAIVDTALVAENILVGAEASGLGVCMIGGIRNNPDKVSKLLKLPERVFPLVGMCLGYPNHEPVIKPRLLPEIPIHFEEYREGTFESLLAHYDEIIRATGLYDGPNRKLPAPDGRMIAEEEYSWAEHTSRRAATTNPVTLRAHLRKFLEDRKFGLG